MTVTVFGLPMDGWAALNLAIQFVLPLLVGLVTNKLTGRKEQFFLLTFLTLVTAGTTSILQEHAAGQAIDLLQIFVTFVVNFLVAILSHYALWKPTNLSDLMLSIFVKPSAPSGAHSAAAPLPLPTPAPAVVAPAAPIEAPAAPVEAPAADATVVPPNMVNPA